MSKLGPKILCTAALWTGLGASASATAPTMDAGLYQSIIDDIAARVVSGARADLRGPCLSPEGLAQVLLDWTPLGASAQEAVAQVLQERGIAPQEVAEWVGTHPEMAALVHMDLDGLSRVVARYERRCDLGSGKATDLAALLGSLPDPPGAAPPARPPASPPAQGPLWEADLDAARARSAADGRPVLAWVRADWSIAAADMERHAWSDDRVVRLVAACFVPFRVDATNQGEQDMALLDRWGVNGVPTTLLVRTSGEASADQRILRVLTADELLKTLQEWCGEPSGGPASPP